MRLSLDRLWLVIAIGLPVLVALLVPLPAVDLAYQVRAGDEILRTAALPGVDTWTFTVAGQPWTDQQWLAQVLLALGYGVGGWELLAVAPCRAGGARPRLLDRRVDGARRQARGWRRSSGCWSSPSPPRRSRSGRSCSGSRSSPRSCGWSRCAPSIRAGCGRRPLLVVLWANIHGSFVLAPLVLGYAWLDDVARKRPQRQSLSVLVVGLLATFVNAVRPRRLGLRGGDRRQPGDHRPGQRVAADDAAHGAGGAVLRLGDRDAAGDVARPAGAALARLAVDRRDARDRRVDGPRPRLVAVRGGIRGRRGAPARPGLAPAGGRRRCGATREPGRRDLRLRVRPRHRRRAALVAARGPADRPRRPALLRPVGAGAGGRDPGAAGREGVRPADVGVVVRVGRTGARLLPRLPLRAVPGRRLGRLRA